MRKRASVMFLVLGVTAVAAAGCGKSDESSDGSGKSDGKGGGPKVGLVTDIGGLNDRSFNALANKGFTAAKEDGASGTILESKAAGDYEPNLGKLAQDGADIVFGIGFLMGDSVKATAAKSPDTNFAIIDFSYDPDTPKNVQGIVFKEQEAGYLAGVLAGKAESEGTMEGLNEAKVVSAIGGQKIPPVDKFIAGFKAGVEAECADCKVLVDYSQDFVDQSKCQDLANKQIARGSDIVFQVAGGCGLGALNAAKTRKVWGIGVDADQGYLGGHILTSAMKRVDTAVEETIKSVGDDEFEGGSTRVFGLKEEGVGLGEIAEPAQQYEDVVDAAREKILDGFTVPETV